MTEESILDQMGIQPFDKSDKLDIDEIDYWPPPPKQRTSIQLSTGTRLEIDELTSQGYGNLSEIVALAVHQMYVLIRKEKNHEMA